LKALTPGEIEAVEQAVNRYIRQNAPVSWQNVSLAEAKEAGATMLFGEKYADMVRLVAVEGISRELCGGTHLLRTGQIGLFVIVHESSVGAGLRRIEGLTGRGAESHVREQLALLTRIAAELGVPSPDDAEAKLAELRDRARSQEKELERMAGALARARAESLSGGVVEVGGVKVASACVEARDAADLRAQADAMRDQLGSGVVVVGSVIGEAPRLVATITPDLVADGLHAGEIVKAVAAAIGGGGGGRPNIAEAGGKDAAALQEAVASAPDVVRRLQADQA
jgi:alanyl-tRNA synthetase